MSTTLPALLRMSSYAFWTAGGALLPLALDRLIIHPALNEHLGVEIFGAFLWILGIINLVGNVAADGFSTLLMREFARQSAPDAGRMFRTAITLNVGLSFLIIVLVLAGSFTFAEPIVRDTGFSIVLPLGILALVRAVSLLMISSMRIKRRFRTIFGIGIAEAAVLSLILLVAPSGSLWLVGSIYVASALVTLVISCGSTLELRSRCGWLDATWGRWFLQGWAAGALLNFLNGSQLYLSRIVLGAMAEVEDVVVLYAGTAMANLFVIPATVMASLVLSLLGGRSETGLARSERRVYVVFAVVVSVGVAVLAYFAGGWLVSNRYPDLAPRTLTFFHWIALGNGLLSLMILMRPLVVKFGILNRTAGIATVCFTVQFVVLVVLVPVAGAKGAAIGQLVATAIGAIAWTGMVMRLEAN